MKFPLPRSRRRRGTVTRIALILGIVASSLTLTAGTAHAWDYTMTGQFQDWATGRCLDSNQAGQVYTNPCQQGNGYQRWRTLGLRGSGIRGHDRVRLQNVATGRYLRFDGATPSSVVTTSLFENSDEITADGPDWGNVHFIWPGQNWSGPSCLDSNHEGIVYHIACNYGTYQTWRKIWS